MGIEKYILMFTLTCISQYMLMFKVVNFKMFKSIQNTYQDLLI